MTAIQPARIVIIGAGVAGLQAIATAKRMGAVVEVSDVRPAVKEQVESLGGRFIELPELESGEGQGGYAKELTPEFLAKQREILTARVHQADVVITTAQVPGRKPPVLVTAEAVGGMKPGSVIVDMAAGPLGGNCELSKAGEEVLTDNQVTIIAPENLPASMPAGASQFYARNISALLLQLVKDGALHLDFEEEVTAATVITHGGAVVAEPVKQLLQPTTGGAS